MQNSLIPIAFPHRTPPHDGTPILAADIGGTKTDMAFFEVQNGHPVLLKEKRYASAAYNSLVDITREFEEGFPQPARMCISYAGPVRSGSAIGTNLQWGINVREISNALNIPAVFLLNDLEANCYGLAALKEDELQVIYPGKNHEPGNAAVISPGTGLGEGGLYWDGFAYHPFATEGGHGHFAPRNQLDWSLFQYLEKKFGHVSWERVVSGQGISNIFNFLRDVQGWEAPEPLQDTTKKPDPAAISAWAGKGSPICEEALRLFIRFLAQESANLALNLKTTGGIYMGGGILPKIWNAHLAEIFHPYFFAVGRLVPLVEAVPVYLILNQKTAMWGAAYYGMYG